MVKLRPSCVLFGFRLTQNPLVNSPNIDKQLLFPIGSPNCTLSTFPGGGGGGLISYVLADYLSEVP